METLSEEGQWRGGGEEDDRKISRLVFGHWEWEAEMDMEEILVFLAVL